MSSVDIVARGLAQKAIKAVEDAVANGIPGSAGPGVPEGGTSGQILAKSTGEDFETEWVDPPSGGGEAVPDGGTTGQVLAKASDADGDVEWVDPPTGGGGGGTARPWYWSPPEAADFALLPNINADLTVSYADDADIGLRLSCGPSKEGLWPWGIYKDIPNPAADWSVVTHLHITDTHAGYCQLGFVMGRAGSNHVAIFGTEVDQIIGMMADIVNGGYVDGITSGFGNWGRQQHIFLKVEHVASTSKLCFLVGFDGKSWVETTNNRNDDILQGQVPTRIGLGGGWNRGGAVIPQITCDMWVETGFS